MIIEQLLNKPLPTIPQDINTENHNLTFVAFRDKNKILSDTSIQKEAGYVRYENGYYVAMYCEMPNVTKEMLDWWFWWHPQADIRYKAWYPSAHKKIGYATKDKSYFNCENLPKFQNNTQYPREEIGEKTATLRIRFVSPAEFGFDKSVMEENNIVGAICGHVGVKGLFSHTEMCHIIKQTDNGVLLISRFWMGESLKSKLLKKVVLTDSLAKGMTEHCCIEYRNLAEILPCLYEEN